MTQTMSRDVTVLRDLVRAYREVAATERQDPRRDHWRRLHGLEAVRPPVLVRKSAWHDMPPEVRRLKCEDPFFRGYEDGLRRMLFQGTLDDDYVIEPWLTIPATKITPGEGAWGLASEAHHPEEKGGARKFIHPIQDEADIERLLVPEHRIDEDATAERVAKLGGAVGDLIDIHVDRTPLWVMWNGDISTDLGKLRGIEQMMYDMMDRPQWLHRLLAFFRDGVLKAHAEAEAAGDWRAGSHHNQAMPYGPGLPDPAADGPPLPRNRLWGYMASQETTLVGPEMWNEFMLEYQKPILSQFGLAAYGCCEDLTRKIDLLRRIPNLRRIAVAPVADAVSCAEQIGPDYVISYRPSPADMVAYGLDADRIRTILRRDLGALNANDCRADITLKDVETVQQDPTRIRRWVAIVREVIDEVWSA